MRSSDLPEFMRRVSYRVERQSDVAFSVVRYGVRGGIRVVEVYTSSEIAHKVCAALNGVTAFIR
jgi:hypothetical protein